MQSSFPPGRLATPRTETGTDGTGGAKLRGTEHVIRRIYLLLNAAPLGVGILLSCSAQIAGVRVRGRLTLGIVWGILQLVLFVCTTWWYENRAARLPDPPSDVAAPRTAIRAASTVDEIRRYTR